MIKKRLRVFSLTSQFFWQAVGLIMAAGYLMFRLVFPSQQGSHPISRFFRRIFEHKKAKTGWGMFLISNILAVNLLILPLSQLPQLDQQPVMAAPEVVVTTETTYKKPTNGYYSQGFHWYHQAVDLAAPLGEAVYPIAKGRVVSFQYRKWGYGHFVVVEHQDKSRSLYAHLGKINIQAGQSVDKNTCLGEIGLTGWTTGPHLHLEVSQQGRNINPAEILPNQ